MSGLRDGMMGTDLAQGRPGRPYTSYPPHQHPHQHPQGPYSLHTPRTTDQDTQGFVRAPPNKKDHLHRFAGLGVGLGSVFAEHVLSHPCIVLRRQCQVHQSSSYFHLTPFTLFQTIFNIQRHQSVTTLWKGIGSTFMVKGIGVASEAAISEFTPLPKEVTRHSSIKKLAEHLLLKSLGILVTTPFYATSLVETVQSEIASERPGVFDCLREGATRLLGWGTVGPTRQLPVWKLVAPTVTLGLCHYVISSMAQYTVLVSLRTELLESKESAGDSGERSMYETYYPELIATFTGNLLADTMMFPLETVLHRLCMQGTRTIIDDTDTGLGVVPIITRYEGVLDCFRSILLEEGLLGLYRGFGALVLQYALHVIILKLTRFFFERLSQNHPRPPRLSPAELQYYQQQRLAGSPYERHHYEPRSHSTQL